MGAVVVRVRAPEARVSSESDIPDAVTDVVDSLGSSIAPQFAGADDPDLSCYFIVTTPPGEDPEAVAAALRALSEIEAAYVQPEPSLPDASPAM